MSTDLSEFEGISPYTDEEAVAALAEVAKNPYMYVISKAIFPKEKPGYLSNILSNVKSIEDFQTTVMIKATEWDINTTITEFTYDGIENIRDLKGKYLFMSNHRDIILDPTLTQYILNKNRIPMGQICVGSNLLSNKTIERLLKSNRMIKVIRGISARELYNSSMLLSRYIRTVITDDTASVWIAQRQGRAKNGLDTTEQGLLKMLDMSGTGTFQDNYKELCIVPLSISYEYEPCDGRKARELFISQTEKYVKGPREDLHSIITGIRQQKGHVHLSVGKPISLKEIEHAASHDKNERYQALRRIIDARIVDAYHLWKTNYMGYDLMTGGTKYADQYTPEELEAFKQYTAHKLSKFERKLDRKEMSMIFWKIYGNPVLAKELLEKCDKCGVLELDLSEAGV